MSVSFFIARTVNPDLKPDCADCTCVMYVKLYRTAFRTRMCYTCVYMLHMRVQYMLQTNTNKQTIKHTDVKIYF
jgi:hypothetical protein